MRVDLQLPQLPAGEGSQAMAQGGDVSRACERDSDRKERCPEEELQGFLVG